MVKIDTNSENSCIPTEISPCNITQQFDTNIEPEFSPDVSAYILAATNLDNFLCYIEVLSGKVNVTVFYDTLKP